MLIHKKTRSLVFRAKDPQRILTLIPKSRIIKYKGTELLQVRHGHDETKILQNLGIPAPSPMSYYYDWPGPFKPFKHQLEDAPVMADHMRFFNLSDMGAAKTATTLWTVDYLMNEGKVNKCLIVAPLSCINRVWADQIFKLLMHRSFEVLHGTREQRFERLKSDVDFYIVNHDGIKILGYEIAKRQDINCIIIDEAAIYRNKTALWDAMSGAIRPDMRVYGLTATPCPNSPSDAFHQAKLIKPSNVPKYFGQFRNMVCYRASTYKWLPKEEGLEIAFKALTPCVRRKKSECLDLPAVLFERREAALTSDQKRHYETMRRRMAMEEEGQQITAVNAADKLTKLRQIAAGVIRNSDTGEYTVLDYTHRFKSLCEIIEEAGGKVIVFAPFKGLIRDMEDRLRKHWTVEMVNGDISGKARDEIIYRFTENKNPRILLAHPKVASHGLNLQVANTMVWFGPIYSNDQFSQACERMARPGQTNKMTIVMLGATALEWSIYNQLEQQQAVQERILDLYKAEMGGKK